MSVKCFDVVSMVVEEATDRFAPLWKLNNNDYSILRQYCEAIDLLSNEFDGESFEVAVDETKMTITVALECSEIIIGTSNHLFCKLIERAESVGFSASKEGNLNIAFEFPKIWNLA